MTIYLRIKQLRNYVGLSQKDFSFKIGVDNSQYGKIENGKLTPTIKQLMEISSNFNVSIDWLLTGKGTMLKTEGQPTITNALEGSSEGIPLIPFDAVAGFHGGDNPGVRYEDCERYVVPEFEKSGVEFLVRVSGSSMYPKYSNGDILACRKINNILFFQWGKIYVIDSSSQGILVKRIYEDKENPDNIMLISDNKEKYPPHPMPKSDIRSLSIVLGVIRME